MDKLNGYKTYIGAAIIFVAGGLKALNLIDEGIFQTALAVGGAISVFGLRSAMKK